MGPGMSGRASSPQPPRVLPARRGGSTWLRAACGGAAGASPSPVEGASPGSCVWGVRPGRPGSSVPVGFVSRGGVMLAADPQRPPRGAASLQIRKTPRPSGLWVSGIIFNIKLPPSIHTDTALAVSLKLRPVCILSSGAPASCLTHMAQLELGSNKRNLPARDRILCGP